MSDIALSLLPADQWRIYSGYTDAVKAQIDRRLAILAPVLRLPRGHCTALAAAAQRAGISFQTLYRWFRAAKRGDLHELADKSRDSTLWKTKEGQVILPAADILRWKGYVLKFQRDGGAAAAHRRMLRDWRAGKIATTQPLDAMRGHPVGWGYRNLVRHQPTDYELAAVRGGKVRAADYRPQVLTTRAGLRCGQYLVGDDVHHDHVIHWRGHRAPVRCVEASVLDLFPGFLCQWGLRARRLREDGTRENLSEKEVRWTVAAAMRGYGYRADEIGTTWIVENGTFTLRDNVAAPLRDAFGIRVESSEIMSDKAWFGAYGAKGGGNSRFKTWLESVHNLRHNEMAALPGQVGKDPEHTPEEHKGLVRYAERIADAEEHLALVAPELATRLERPVQTYHEFAELCDRVYWQINTRRDHALEGWRECGHEVVQYLLGKQLLDEADFLALPPPEGVTMAQWGRALAMRGQTRTRLLSPAEVAARGRSELSRLPSHGVSIILGPDLAREQTVEAGELVWSDPEIHVGELRYFAEITTPEGRREILRNGETYLVHANPFLLDELCVADAKGRHLGVCRRHDRANRADREAMQKQFAAVAEHEAQLMDELAKKAEPLLLERMGAKKANVSTLREALHGEGSFGARAKAAKKRDEDLAAEAKAALRKRHYAGAPTAKNSP
jgi:hypothetical protein